MHAPFSSPRRPLLLFLPLVAAACAESEADVTGAATCIEAETDAIVPDSMCATAPVVAVDSLGREIPTLNSGGTHITPWIWYYGGTWAQRSNGRFYVQGGSRTPSPSVTWRSATGGYSRPATVRGGFGGTASGRAFNS
jgi:hypothetical protein